MRSFLSYCHLDFIPESIDDTRYEKHQIILVGILTTLCVSARNDFLVFDLKLNEILLWKNGMSLMRNFYCNRTFPVDKEDLIVRRNEFFGKYRLFYDVRRCLARNYQDPNSPDHDHKNAHHEQETAKWTPIIGLPNQHVSIAPAAAMLSPGGGYNLHHNN